MSEIREEILAQTERGKRTIALSLAVLHHGAANFSGRNTPASAETVMTTADYFLDYIDDVPNRTSRRVPQSPR